MIRVLILDDDEMFGHMLADRLRRQPDVEFEVVSTADVKKARQAVKEAAYPFDAFLIDQRLGPGPDGIEVMQELRQLSPDSEAIIFTALDDPKIGLRAYQAGAYRYLPKPFNTPELVWVLQSMHGLKRLTEVAGEVQRALTVRDVAKIIVEGGPQLGFERARLWLLDDDGKTLEGAFEKGNQELDSFAGFRMPVAESPYSQRVLAEREPVYFEGRELGPGYLDRHFAKHGFEPPAGQWVDMPLWAGNLCLGKLALDNASQSRRIHAEQRRLLRLFGRQAAAALERARLFEQETRKSKELEILNQIGQRVTTRAALDDLDTLLREVRTQVGTLMDVRNFMVVLLDEEADQLEFRLHFENNKLKRRHWRKQGAGLVGHLIAKNKHLFLPQGGKAFREARSIPLFGRQYKCWLGVPLRVGDKAVGAIAVQSYEEEWAYSKEDLRLLTLVADQVAGAIQTAHLKEREAESSRQLGLLHQAIAEMMKLAEEDEDWLWHASLTVATAEYGLSFNRAVLFLAEEGGTRLRGRMGIGHFSSLKVRRDWRRDRRVDLDFDVYLQRLRTCRLKPTPVEEAVRNWVLNLNRDESVFRQVLRKGQRVLVPAAEVSQRLPQAFVERFGTTDYAVVPLHAGRKVLGLVVVDNIHDQKPLHTTTLEHLETLLAQAALILENLRQRHGRDQVIDLNYTIMAEVSNRPLKETLTRVCRAAQAVTGADYVAIYPLKPGVEPYQYEVGNVGYVGNESDLHLKSKLRQKGVTAHILRAGALVVPDVSQHRRRYDGQRLADHPFLQRERIRAFIGTPVCDVTTGDLYGVLYLDYRTPQAFTEQDVRQAESFASLAAVAIRNARAAQWVRDGLVAAEAESRAREKELAILRRVLEESLAADTDEERVVRALINAARELLGQPEARVGLLLRKWTSLAAPDQELQEVRHQYFLNLAGELSKGEEPDIYRGISGLALKTGKTQPAHDVHHRRWAEYFYDDSIGTLSELDVPINLGAQAIGVFNVEFPTSGAFTPTDKATLERLAAAAALALDNVRRQEHLYNVLSAAKAVTAPTGLKETLAAIVAAVQEAAPGLSALTIWYREPESARIVLGPHYGVHHVARMEQEEVAEESVVWKVMQESKPIWAPVAMNEPRLVGRFIKEERIESVAAFQLQADDEVVGAMFFNYHQPHEFIREEKALFPILAEIAAASVRDASRLEATHKERQRLKAALAVAEAVGGTLNLDQTLRRILHKLVELFPDATLCVLTYDEVEHELEFTPASQAFYPIDNPAYADLRRVPVDGPGIATRLVREFLHGNGREFVNLGDVSLDDDYLSLISDTQSELCMILRSNDRLLGVLIVERQERQAFDEDDVALVRSVAQQISVALDRARQSADLRFKTTVAATTAWAARIAHIANREVAYIRNRAYWLYEAARVTNEVHQWAIEIDEGAERLAAAFPGVRPSHTQPRPISLDEHLRQWINRMVQERDAQVELRMDLRCQGMQVEAQPEVLRRVVGDLVRNALEAMGNAGTIMVRTRPVREQWIEVQIEDTGPGVPDDLLQVILQDRVETKGEGHGFGLLFVRMMIEHLGGRVRLLPPRKGRGAVFAFTVPIATMELDTEA